MIPDDALNDPGLRLAGLIEIRIEQVQRSEREGGGPVGKGKASKSTDGFLTR